MNSASDTKILRSADDQYILQGDLDRLHKWCIKGGKFMPLNDQFVLKFGYNNPNYTYSIESQLLEDINEQKDL